MTKTSECYKKIDQKIKSEIKGPMRVNKETDIAKLSFQIANRLDRNKTQAVEIVGMGPCITRVVKTVELLKRVLAGLHLAIEIVDVIAEETYEPLY
jgi:hypothetical protein